MWRRASAVVGCAAAAIMLESAGVNAEATHLTTLNFEEHIAGKTVFIKVCQVGVTVQPIWLLGENGGCHECRTRCVNHLFLAYLLTACSCVLPYLLHHTFSFLPLEIIVSSG